MSPEVTFKVKEDIKRLIKAGFIGIARYVEWLSNVVRVMKKNEKLEVCIDFQNLNLAIPMPMVDLLVDGAAKHIFIAEEDVPKTSFRCLGAIGTFEWVIILFSPKNVGATCQRAMNAIFHAMIGHLLNVYIDDVIVKSDAMKDHVVYLRKAFEQMNETQLKMNPLKCAFGVFVCVPKSTKREKDITSILESEMDPVEITSIFLTPWKLSFDGSQTQTLVRVEYEALIIDLEILKELGVYSGNN
ncbi:uncharacterized protein LOC132803566 [Ziziphus jujuba]|uniref:Uncharacterized protein LOC132803566 n=1 Tax=Ziziphus jujuba TaxID=326968 RepID=A0ABM4A7R4_ZIZJJ|nr:uncharacterized protein LOC132803566 [Ziziphus jujuba]